MNVQTFLNQNLICPQCLDQQKKEVPLKKSKSGYLCTNCNKIYPNKKIVYTLKHRCQPKKCNYECKKACKKNAFTKSILAKKGYFMLGSLLKNLVRPKIFINEKCNNCASCVEKCPFNALIAIKTPVFLISSSFDHTKKQKNNTSDIELQNLQLRPHLREKEIRPAPLLLYKAIANEVKKQKQKQILIDNGCGPNLLKTFLPPKTNLLSFDIHISHDAFYPLHGIVSGEYLPLKAKTVDLFLSITVLEHVTDPIKYLKEMQRVLKDKGKLILAVPSPQWHISKLLSLHHHFSYLLHILKNPFKFLKTPIKNFDLFWAHEKDCNYEYAKQKMTLSKEIKNFKNARWKELFNKSGFFIEKRIGIGNIFSNNIFWGGLTKKIGNSKKCPIFYIYILKK